MPMTFGPHTLSDARHSLGFTRYRITFPNGFGASVITGGVASGAHDRLGGVGVRGPHRRQTHETPITDDLIGYQ